MCPHFRVLSDSIGPRLNTKADLTVAPLNTKFLVWRNNSLKEFALVGIVHIISSVVLRYSC